MPITSSGYLWYGLLNYSHSLHDSFKEWGICFIRVLTVHSTKRNKKQQRVTLVSMTFPYSVVGRTRRCLASRLNRMKSQLELALRLWTWWRLQQGGMLWAGCRAILWGYPLGSRRANIFLFSRSKPQAISPSCKGSSSSHWPYSGITAIGAWYSDFIARYLNLNFPPSSEMGGWMTFTRRWHVMSRF